MKGTRETLVYITQKVLFFIKKNHSFLKKIINYMTICKIIT
jgi:hypothetical protein